MAASKILHTKITMSVSLLMEGSVQRQRPGEVSVMNDDEQPEEYQPPIGTAGLACFGCLAVVYLTTKPFIGFLDRWGD